ncbi:hypothetical protein CBR_g38631 [Chara braunii]|uniref:DUF659 domain-containing protein n=1 Tax=Chara braunii TaxID=69332 RepID=A0A388K0M0_CHABU|nr:hypothetical protein CBR_g38631 [Chara braunii]|eukprot:GBG63565.1 hypothetical protein CBR_g38631 [Chara braunii]
MTGGDEERGSRGRATAAAKAKGPAVPVVDKPESSTRRTTSALATSAGWGKEPTPRTDASLFQGRSEAAHVALRKKNKVWIWCEQGQEVATSKGRGEYWVRCRLCSTIWRESAHKAAEHFLKSMKPCALRTGEIVHTLVAGSAKLQPNDKNTEYLLRNYKGGEAESHVHRRHASCGEEGLEDPQTDEPEPPPLAGRAVVGIANMIADPLDEAVEGGGAAEGGGGEEGQGSTARTTTFRQTNVRRWVDNATQKKLDIVWVEAMFRAGIAFNFLNMDTTQTLHVVDLEVANSRPKVKLPSYNYMRTVMLDIIYMKIQKEVNLMTSCWDSIGYTFITDGSTDRKNQPVMNFLAAGEQGAMLVTMVTMSGRKKNVVALAKLWEQIMREIGLQRINAICTNNAEVNKKATRILELRKDKDVARTPWVPCGAHCCSLLLKNLANLSWIKGTVKTANTIVKFIRNHHATQDWMMIVDDSLSLLRPTEVQFGSVYQMLQRLADREDVLVEMVDGRSAGKWRALRRSGEKFCRRSDLVYYTVRSEIGGEWNSKAHSGLWGELMEFQKQPARVVTENVCTEPDKAMKKRKDEHMWEQPVVDDVKRLNPTTWWAAHGGDVPTLQAIAIKQRPRGYGVEGKCWNESSSEDSSEDEDSDFELGAVPAVPGTTYVGRRTRRQDRDLEVEPTPTVNRVDTDVQFLLHRHDDRDEEEASRAKEMADRDRELVDRRVAEEEARCAAIPTRRERERCAAQQEKHGGEALKEMDGDVQPAMGKGEQQQGEPADAAEEQQAAIVVYTRKPGPCVEQEVGAERETTNQQVAIGERGKEQQEEPQAAEDIGTPPFPELNDVLHHDNLWKSRAGRKRKATAEESHKAPRRGRGRPRKEMTVKKTASQHGRRNTTGDKKRVISDDDPDSDGSPPQSLDGGISPCQSD